MTDLLPPPRTSRAPAPAPIRPPHFTRTPRLPRPPRVRRLDCRPGPRLLRLVPPGYCPGCTLARARRLLRDLDPFGPPQRRPFAQFAAGDVMLDSNGNVILDSSGNVLLDDGAGCSSCCGSAGRCPGCGGHVNCQVTLAGWSFPGTIGTCYCGTAPCFTTPECSEFITFSVNGTHCVPTAGFFYDAILGDCYCRYYLEIAGGYDVEKRCGPCYSNPPDFQLVNWAIEIHLYTDYFVNPTSQAQCDATTAAPTDWWVTMHAVGGVRDNLGMVTAGDRNIVVEKSCFPAGFGCLQKVSCGDVINYVYDASSGTNMAVDGAGTQIDLVQGTVTIGIATC